MPTKIERILVPVDFSSCSEAALAYAAGLARKVGARVDVLHAWEAPAIPADLPLPVEEFQTGARREAERLLDDLVARHRAADEPVRAHLAAGSAVPTILGQLAIGEHDLIVIGTHGRRGLVRAVLGSVAEEVLRRAPCPVLCVREMARP